MSFLEILLIGVGLSMDAFAASVCKGLNMRKFYLLNAIIIGFMFGLFQALMPLTGWFVGIHIAEDIAFIGHWIAFGLLAIIGGKMILESSKDCGNEKKTGIIDIKNLIMLSIATSIDALAAGITFSCMNVDIVFPIIIIGLITFVLSVVGVGIGNKFGGKYKQKAEIIGGIILILIGVKILIEHQFYSH